MKTYSQTRVVGYIGSVDVRPTSTGFFVGMLSVASTESWIPKAQKSLPREEQKWETTTTWHRFKFLGPVWEEKFKVLSSGLPVEVLGTFQQEKYEDKDGEQKISTYFRGNFLNVLTRSAKTYEPSPEEEGEYDGDDLF